MNVLPQSMTETTAPPGRHLLREIATALGVDIAAFDAKQSYHLVHTSEDGTQWFLAATSEGTPIVRCVRGRFIGPGPADEPVARFLAQHGHTPQGRAVEAFINRLLLTCLR